MSTTMSTTDLADTIVEEITINASALRVFAALTNPDERRTWWGAAGRFETTDMESDLRPGGKWEMRGTGMGGKPFTVSGVYRVVDPPRLLSFTWLPSWQQEATESLVQFELTEKDGVTTVRLTHSGLTPPPRRRIRAGRKFCSGSARLPKAEATILRSRVAPLPAVFNLAP